MVVAAQPLLSFGDDNQRRQLVLQVLPLPQRPIEPLALPPGRLTEHLVHTAADCLVVARNRFPNPQPPEHLGPLSHAASRKHAALFAHRTGSVPGRKSIPTPST